MINNKLDINICFYFFNYINGTIVDSLDVYYNLSKLYKNVKLYCLNDYIYQINSSKFKITNQLHKCLSKYYNKNFTNNVMTNVILISPNRNNDVEHIKKCIFVLPYNVYKLSHNIKFKALQSNTFVIGDLELFLSNESNELNKIESDNLTFMTMFPLYNNNYTYYINKFSQYRLDNMLIGNNSEIFSDFDNYQSNKRLNDFNVNNYSELNFSRKTFNYKGCSYNIEIKGKSLFEFLYFGKKVYYNSVPKTHHDGLEYLLAYFNIDDSVDQYLEINKEDIYNKLIKFDENDLLVQKINNIL